MVKPIKFLWLLLEIEVLREEQADSTLTGCHKISDTKSRVSFQSKREKCFGKNHMGLVSPFSAYGDKEL